MIMEKWADRLKRNPDLIRHNRKLLFRAAREATSDFLQLKNAVDDLSNTVPFIGSVIYAGRLRFVRFMILLPVSDRLRRLLHSAKRVIFGLFRSVTAGRTSA
jgi:hypothetical protein